MKTFKHKKTGDIAIMKSNNSSFYTYDGMDIHARIVENSTDWEEIVEYPIGTRVKNLETDTEIHKREDGWYKEDKTAFTDEMIKKGEGKRFQVIEEPKKDYEILSWYFGDMNITKEPDGTVREYFIHSVKRLSDGEVFTIGDKCFPIGEESNNIHPVDRFDLILDNQLRVNSKNWYMNIDGIQKAKPVLFTTENGVDIREGDNWFSVYAPGYTGSFKDWTIKERAKNTNLSIWLHDKSIKRFSTKEAAEEYIIMNKPCLSINDVKDILSFYGFNKPHYREEVYKDLKQLVKSKL